MASSTSASTSTSTSARMPVVFVGHGSPMNALEDNRWNRGWRALAGTLPTLPRLRAILCVSAHWYVPGTYVTDNEEPETIHDFGGFPRPLFEVQYPARGAPELATRITRALEAVHASPRGDWGLDHGTWSVLVHLYPNADVPVLQLSIDRRLPAADHLRIGRALAPLRDEGVLILGSGNVTHNLRHAMTARTQETPAWAASFDSDVARALEAHDGPALADLITTEAGRLSHPSPDHYFPLLYAAGAASNDDHVAFPVTGFDLGSLSMRSVVLGGEPPA